MACTPYSEIARRLTAAGFKTRNGGTWRAQLVKAYFRPASEASLTLADVLSETLTPVPGTLNQQEARFFQQSDGTRLGVLYQCQARQEEPGKGYGSLSANRNLMMDRQEYCKSAPT